MCARVGASAQGGGCRQPEDPADARILGRRFPSMYQLHGEPDTPPREAGGRGLPEKPHTALGLSGRAPRCGGGGLRGRDLIGDLERM